MSLQYQDFLLEEFRSRRARNPHYSLRAYARDIGMPASKLSQNLRGLCGISVAKAEAIADKLQLREDERQLFLALVESRHGRSRVVREQAREALAKIRLEKIDELTLEKFAVVRDWQHTAIRELFMVKGFRGEPKWIAERLGLTPEAVCEAIERLKQVDLLIEEEGRLRLTQRDIELPGGVPSRTVREHHKQMLGKAIKAIDEVPVEKREYSSQTFAVDRKLVPELKELIREFQHKVSRLSHQGLKDSVYAMTLQLFPIAEVEE